MIVGCKFEERDDDKVALFHSRMRNVEAGFADTFVPIHKDIQIEGARAIADAGGAIASEFLFDGEESGKEGAGGKCGVEGEDSVEETGLVSEANRLSGIQRGAGGDVAEGFQAGRSGGESGLGVASGAGEIGAEAYVGDGH